MGTWDLKSEPAWNSPLKVVKRHKFIPKCHYFRFRNYRKDLIFFFLTTSILLNNLFEDIVSPLFSQAFESNLSGAMWKWEIHCNVPTRTGLYSSGRLCIQYALLFPFLDSWLSAFVKHYANIFAPCTELPSGDRHYRPFCAILNILLYSCLQKHLFFMAIRFFQTIRDSPRI